MIGTFVTVGLPKMQQSLLQEGFNRLKAIEHALSSFEPSATIYRLNQHKTLHVDSYTLEAIALAMTYYHKSEGYFDITVGSLTKDAYRFGVDDAYDATAVKAAKVGIDGLHVDEDVVSLDSGIKLDFGGMGKGFGVDKVYTLFKQRGVKEGLIKLSGDIRCIGHCRVDISDPFKPDSIFATFKTKKANLAISTSGNYRRYKKSKKYNHLIDPKRRQSEQNFASLTLILQGSNAYIDAMATAIMVMPKRRALEFLKQSDFGYILVDNEGKIYMSKTLDYFVEFKLLYALK